MNTVETFIPKFIVCYIVRRTVDRQTTTLFNTRKFNPKDYNFHQIYFNQQDADVKYKQLLQEEIPKEYCGLKVRQTCQKVPAIYNETTKDISLLGMINPWIWNAEKQIHTATECVQINTNPYLKEDERFIQALPDAPARNPAEDLFGNFFGGGAKMLVSSIEEFD